MPRTQTFSNNEQGLSVRTKLNSLSSWNSLYSYGVDDATHFSGSVYFSLVDGNLGNVPTNVSFWKLGGTTLTSGSTYPITSSWAENTTTSSFIVITSSVQITSSISSSWASHSLSASWAPMPVIPSTDSASWASSSLSSSYPWRVSGSNNVHWSGSVSIGTTSSIKQLTVEGPRDTGIAISTLTGSRESFLDLYAGGVQIGSVEGFGEHWSVVNRRNSLSFTSQVVNSGSIVFTTRTGSSVPSSSWFDRMVITNEGNVGIGVFPPSATLHVQGNISASSITASVFGSASFATTSSYALNAGTGGTTLVTASTYQITSSWSNNSVTSSYALNGVIGLAYIDGGTASSIYGGMTSIDGGTA